jgi:hypothetical protein
MAIYQGARPAPLVMPRQRAVAIPRRAAVPARRRPGGDRGSAVGRGAPIPRGDPTTAAATSLRGAVATTRRRATRTIRADRRPRTVLVTLALIVTAFVLGLMYLTQSIRVAATSFEIDRLSADRQRLQQQVQSLEGAITQYGAEPAVVQRAGQAGLDRLGGAIRLPAR